MKKFVKFLFTTFSLLALGAGAFYFVKKYICKSSEADDEMDDFIDYDDLDEDEHLGEFPNLDSNTVRNKGTREYVTLNMGDAKETIKDTMESVKETVHNTVDAVKDTVSNTVDTVKDTVGNTISEVKETVSDATQDVKDSVNVTVIDLDKDDAE